MRYAIISDVHSNLEALKASFELINKLEIESVISLGDIVGYNANPIECIDILKENNVRSIVGNHDLVACGITEPDNFNYIAMEAALWTRNKLRNEDKVFLKSLPTSIIIDNNFICVHGSPFDPDYYILSTYDAIESFKYITSNNLPKICFFGHTHRKAHYILSGKALLNGKNDIIKIDENNIYLINPGSIGQPRDGDPRSSFLTYDSGSNIIKFYRVSYDIKTCASKIIAENLSIHLAERLYVGW
jgi:predicted phosphodiesterase